MSARPVVISALALALLVGAAPAAEERGGRYVMTPTEGGFLRLDSQTGAVSICQRNSGKWSCDAVPDDRRALEEEIERLNAENKSLNGAIKRLEDLLALPNSDDKSRSAQKVGPKFQLPSEEDLDRAMTYIQRMMRKFKDKLREMEQDRDRRSL
jgi:hypothetical protein